MKCTRTQMYGESNLQIMATITKTVHGTGDGMWDWFNVDECT